MDGVAPIRLTDRQEQFCQQIIKAKSQAEAYRIAYGASQKASEANGARLIASARVKARIEQIREDMRAAERIDLPFLTRALIRQMGLAERLLQPAAATAASMGLAKLHGYLVDKSLHEHVIRKPTADPESPDEMSEGDWVVLHGVTYDRIEDNSLDKSNSPQEHSPTEIDLVNTTPQPEDTETILDSTSPVETNTVDNAELHELFGALMEKDE